MGTLRQWTHHEFCRMAERNGYHYMRSNGSHSIYVNKEGRHMSIPLRLVSVIARRLIKENNLDINLKRRKSMYNNYDYPAGADTPDAPWNDPEIPEKEFDVTCSQSLSKTVTVTTNNYVPGACGVDYEPDDEGGYCSVGWHDPDDTSDTNWGEEYHSNDYHTPLQLIELFGKFLQEQLSKGIVFKSPKFTESLIKECEGWSEDETEYIEE